MGLGGPELTRSCLYCLIYIISYFLAFVKLCFGHFLILSISPETQTPYLSRTSSHPHPSHHHSKTPARFSHSFSEADFVKAFRIHSAYDKPCNQLPLMCWERRGSSLVGSMLNFKCPTTTLQTIWFRVGIKSKIH